MTTKSAVAFTSDPPPAAKSSKTAQSAQKSPVPKFPARRPFPPQAHRPTGVPSTRFLTTTVPLGTPVGQPGPNPKNLTRTRIPKETIEFRPLATWRRQSTFNPRKWRHSAAQSTIQFRYRAHSPGLRVFTLFPFIKARPKILFLRSFSVLFCVGAGKLQPAGQLRSYAIFVLNDISDPSFTSGTYDASPYGESRPYIFQTPVIQGQKSCTKFDRLNDFLSFILKLRNVKICEHSIFVPLLSTDMRNGTKQMMFDY